MTKTAETAIKGYHFKGHMFDRNTLEWFQKNGASVVAKVGEEQVKFEVSFSVPVELAGARILPIMAVASVLNALARSEGVPDVDAIAAKYVAQHWFPVAAADYAASHWDEFVDEESGNLNRNEEALFEKVMRQVFWTLNDFEMSDPDSFEDKVWDEIPEAVFTDVFDAMKEAAADGRAARNPYAYHGVAQRDFL